MSPSEVETQAPAANAQAMEMTNTQQPILTNQPKPQQGMDPARPHPESELSLRGGDGGRGGCCPGRFCFCIPCPLPCDCCIFPCPCP